MLTADYIAITPTILCIIALILLVLWAIRTPNWLSQIIEQSQTADFESHPFIIMLGAVFVSVVIMGVVDSNAIFYSLLIIWALYVENWIYGAIEESKIVGLRAHPLAIVAIALLVCAAMLRVIDDELFHYFDGIKNNANVLFNYSYIATSIIAVLALGRYINFSTWTDKVVILILGVFFGRFMAGLLGDSWEAYGFLYIAFFYYIIFNVVYLEKNPYFRLPWVALIGFVLVPLVYFIDQLREYGLYATYITVVYMLLLVTRYLWNLEFKRRTRCETCSGWGSKPIKPTHTPWWAIGKKQTAASQTCPDCQGKGWKYRYPEYLHD